MIYELTCGCHQQRVHTKYLSKKRHHLNYRQWKNKLREGRDSALNNMSLENKIPTVADLMESTLDIFITLVVNYCGNEGTIKELIVNWVHMLLLMAYSEYSKEDNTNWNQGNEWSL